MPTLFVSDPLVSPLPAQASVPFAKGVASRLDACEVTSPSGKTCLCQARPLLRWPDGSVKWALVVFDPRGETGAFSFSAEGGNGAYHPALADEIEGCVVVDTGCIRFSVPTRLAENVNERSEGMLTDLALVRGDDAIPLTAPGLDAGLVVTEADGRVYSTQKAGPDFVPIRAPGMPDAGVCIVENGPLRCRVRMGAKCCHDNYRVSLDAVLVAEAYRGSPLVRLRIAWRHGKDGNERYARQPEREARFIRDIRLRLPLAFHAKQVRFGLERGHQYTEEIVQGSRYAQAQIDYDRAEARREDWDGTVLPMAHGAADGEAAPGWAQVFGRRGELLSVGVPGFVSEYPNEIALSAGAVELGLWPETANRAMRGKRILPPHPSEDPALRHRHDAYECLMTHPYVAFFNQELGCLETVKGMQKSQDILLSAEAGLDGAEWAARLAGNSLACPFAAVDPAGVDATGALGRIARAAPKEESPAEAALERAAAWFPRHEAYYRVRGKFDYGDLRYLESSPYEGLFRHASLKVHPRAGYWNNNEEDPIHGLWLHVLRTGDAAHLPRIEAMGRHLWDVDVRHYPGWGMHTHCYGHCFRALGSQATDHFWIASLIDYYLLTGDPDVYAGIEGLARYAADHLKAIQFAKTNLREASIAILQCVDYYHVLHEERLLDAAEEMAGQILGEQHPEGWFPRVGREAAKRTEPHLTGPSALFGTLALEALAALEEVRPNDAWREGALRQIDWFLDKGLLPAGDGLVSRPNPAGKRPKGAAGYPAGWFDYKLTDFQLLKAMASAVEWSRETDDHGRVERYMQAGGRILDRLVRVQMDETYGPQYAGNWNPSERIADPKPGESPSESRPLEPIDPARCPYQVRPLGVSAALRCLPAWLAVHRRE